MSEEAKLTKYWKVGLVSCQGNDVSWMCFHGWDKFLAMQMKLENLTLFKNLLTLQFCKHCLSVLLFRCQLCLVLT